MNFLAHLYLSGDNTKIMVGNFIGDFVKGRKLNFEPEIAKGIVLHRAIDEFTDHHPVVLKSKIRLRTKYRHYAPVIVDIFYDHFLSKYWNNYHSDPLSEYAKHAYETIEAFSLILPQEVKNILPYMINGNWLVNYGQMAGVERALKGMAKRTKFNSKMDESIVDLQAHYENFKNEFEEFFPDLKNFCTAFIDQKI